MGQRLKKLGCYILIIILLPYVVTVFINGPSSVSSSQVDSTDIRVKTEAGEIQNAHRRVLHWNFSKRNSGGL